MKKTRFSDEQIVKILREAERDGVCVSAKKYGISEQSIYAWRKRFNGMGSEEVKRLKALEAGNARLKKLLVDRDLEIEVMKEIAAKKW